MKAQVMTDKKQRRFPFVIFWLLLLGSFLFQIVDFGASDVEEDNWARLPVSIRASSQADYSRDSKAFLVQPVSENIFEQIIHDLQGTGDPQDRISTLEVSLSVPVPTMTPNSQMPTVLPFTATSSIPNSATPQATPSFAVTNTVVTPTPTVTLGSNSPTPVAPPATSIPPATKKTKPTTRPKPTRRP